MRLQTISSMRTGMRKLGQKPSLPDEVAVKRSDPIYNAHAYLTKVPMAAITPFIEAFTEPGDLVLDCFAGSGMTGVAAAALSRRAMLFDISELGRHIGENYVNLVDPAELRETANDVMDRARQRLGDSYATRCNACGKTAELSRTVWSVIYKCASCGDSINYFRSLELAGWSKRSMCCDDCGTRFETRAAPRIGEQPVMDTISCSCSRTLRDQPHSAPIEPPKIQGLAWPEVEIEPTRQMFQASALRKHNLMTISSFFSLRNLAVLTALRDEINSVKSDNTRNKLLFAFTAILTRASKRYQWSRKRPLNAANQNYYIAPVFYEWNVYDLFSRKVDAIIRSDNYLRDQIQVLFSPSDVEVRYDIGSAEMLELPDESVDYVFTDPPFGSNIFYSDMNLFQEAWLGRLTDHSREAVVDRSGNGKATRTAQHYEGLIEGALRECHRVLKPGCWLSLVFSNSSGDMWALIQRAIHSSGFDLEAEGITLLDKGQRSVKGLASGFENVVTADLILSMQKSDSALLTAPAEPPEGTIASLVETAISNGRSPTPSHVYLFVVREFLRRHWDLSSLSIAKVGEVLLSLGMEVDPASGRLIHDK